MVVALIAAALAAASVPATPPARLAPDADPAIWVVNDRDTVIFLFGTFHALDGKSDWFNDEVRTAFTSSDELMLETIVPEPYRSPSPASGSSGPVAVAPSAGRLLPSIDTHGDVRWTRHRACRRRYGADSILRLAAEDAGKAGRRAGKLRIPARHVQPDARGRLRRRAPVEDAGRKATCRPCLMGELQTAWNRGDPGILRAMLEQMRANSPDTYNDVHRAERPLGRMDRQPAGSAGNGVRRRRSRPSRRQGQRPAAGSPRRGIASRPRSARPSPTCHSRPRAPIGARLPTHGHPWRRGGAYLSKENAK